MTETDARWARLKAVFEAALDAPAGRREAVIEAAGLAPPDEAELRSLLAHHAASATGGEAFLGQNVAAERVQSAIRPGQRLGPWEVVRAVGAGGMGEVVEARRADGQFEGRAAVKLLKRGMDSAAVLQRFALERQALARLSHPGIARLLDAGASAEGLPYFVMEFVDGRPIDQAVQGLDLEQRLGLFLQLADAVAHAHRNLLVHRDLKPGNVLVDEAGQVKLLDFGIAKALDPLEGLDSADTTVGGQRPYTPNYASPEQVRGEPVSTATDIYSLGVLLYQLLTGTRPTGRKATTAQEAARSVLQDAPTRPSRLSPTEALDPQWLRNRKRLEGDLDNILLKALEKEPERRYPSVDALRADVAAFLSGHPVAARPATWAYRSAKWLGRNRLAGALAAGALLSLVGGLGATAWQAHAARQAQQLAEARLGEVRRITHELVFGFGDSVEYLPGGQKIKVDLLNDTLAALARLRPSLGDDPALLADLAQVRVRLAEAHMPGYPNSLNQAEAATGHAREALVLVERAWPARKRDPLFATYASRAYSLMSSVEQQAGRLEEAVAQNRRGLALAEEALAVGPTAGPERLRLMTAIDASQFNLGLMLDDNGVGLGRPAEAMAAYRQALDGLRRQAGMTAEAAALDARERAEHTSFMAELGRTEAFVLGSISSSLSRRGDYAGAAQARREAVARLRQVQALHPEQLQFIAGLAGSLGLQAGLELQMARPAEALAVAREAMRWTQTLRDKEPDNKEWADDIGLRALPLGTALALTGASAEAGPWLAKGRDYWQAELKTEPLARNRRNLAVAELRGARAQGDWPAVARAAGQLRSLAEKEPKSADAALAEAEGGYWLAAQGPSAGRAAARTAACEAWARAAPLRTLPPQADVWRAELGC